MRSSCATMATSEAKSILCRPRFGWYKDLTFQGIVQRKRGGQCGDRCSDETTAARFASGLSVATAHDQSRKECDEVASGPVRMPGLRHFVHKPGNHSGIECYSEDSHLQL